MKQKFNSDNYDDLTRFLSQTESLVCSLICDDHSTIIGEAHTAKLIWLIQDRLEDIRSSAGKLWDQYNPPKQEEPATKLPTAPGTAFLQQTTIEIRLY